MKQKDDQHKEVMAKMEVSFENARVAYANIVAERDALKLEGADLKAQVEEMKGRKKEMEAENASLETKVEKLQATKVWMLSERAELLAKNIHKGPEMTAAVAAVNNAMSAVGINSGLHNGYIHALQKKTPFKDVLMLNRNAAEDLNTVVACFDTLKFPVVEDLPKLINAPLAEIKKALFFVGGGSLKK
ncbi:hypothetical protein HanXRQr2_Chr08g0332261 [Helianthus annuus]|uniref:Uncharacterized protein n=1 Tax=Helianthus annuus TaxID=4232 RepID=A0A9K3IE13_HELAN|nr:hypothetical protein HanXRQr2_Chr08g0332261 [Helianthus annuus]KAJ0718710.1 hypothetical protein HanLR1_Chr08g0273581 [Helianthus annuus]